MIRTSLLNGERCRNALMPSIVVDVLVTMVVVATAAAVAMLVLTVVKYIIVIQSVAADVVEPSLSYRLSLPKQLNALSVRIMI